jgi:hypothetical protein
VAANEALKLSMAEFTAGAVIAVAAIGFIISKIY